MSTVTISAADINKLRQATGAGMMDCRKALTETNGDFEAAIDWLRKQGQKVAAKRSDREAKEGVVIAKTTADNKTGIVVCVSCETDFVSKNADFVAFAQNIADVRLGCLRADYQVLGYCMVAVALGDQLEHLYLTFTQRLGLGLGLWLGGRKFLHQAAYHPRVER